MRALMRAVNEPGLQQQVQALSEALESYVAGVEVAELFSKAQRKELRELAPDWLNRDEALRGISVVSRALLFGIAARAEAADELARA